MLPFRDRKSFEVDSNANALELLQNNINWELSTIPNHYNKILVGHLAIEGSIPIGDEIDDMTNELFCPLSMFDKYNYVWMGHVHKPQVLRKSPNYIAHVGSMDISNFGEADHKKHIVIFDLDSKTFNTETLPTRQLKKISLTIPKDIKDTTSFINDEIDKLDLNKSIVKIEILLSDICLDSVNKSLIEKKLIDKGVYSISGIFETKKSQSIIKKEQNSSFDSKMDLNSAIKEYAKTYVDEPDRQEFSNLALEIIKELKD
jgi:DNA repair exonuclease SbcCD nuclease subunit